MKIIADKNIPFLEGRISGADLVMLPAGDINKETVRDADALIVRTRTHCDEDLLKGSRVRLVATATIGTDHIDLRWCEENGISVRNAPGCNAPGVALYVWSALLRAGFDPEKSTLGVIGCGNVGGIVAQWGRRLGAEVLVCDPPRKERGLTDWDYRSLEEVLGRSDAITLHVPLTYTGKYPTYHLIGEGSIGYLKRGSILVNAARGEVTDSATLIRAVEDGNISKAIIDTWEGEPQLNRRLLELADVATCHIAGYSVEGKQRATRMALEAVRDSLGLEVDLSGLEGPYREPKQLDKERIMIGYDPSAMTLSLKNNPEKFEALRNSYTLHSEIIEN